MCVICIPTNYIWLVVDLPLWKYEFVSWDDDIPNTGKNTIHVPNHQPVMEYFGILWDIIGTVS